MQIAYKTLHAKNVKSALYRKIGGTNKYATSEKITRNRVEQTKPGPTLWDRVGWYWGNAMFLKSVGKMNCHTSATIPETRDGRHRPS